MGRKKRTRLRAIGRWMVWVCTILLLLLILISIWLRPGARIIYTSTTYVNRGIILDLSAGRFKALFSSGYAVQSNVPSPTVGFDLEYWDRWPTVEKRSTVRWLSPVWWHSGQAIRGPEVSLIYPAAFGLIWSGLIWHRRPRFPAGHCVACGYSLDGLTSDVCPECGEKHA